MDRDGREIVLGIETSCDDTCAAVVAGGTEVLSSVVSSQDPLHARFGGIVPEHASRKHLELIVPVIDQALDTAAVSSASLACIAVTTGPGLVGSLLVGLSTAKALSLAWGIPLVAVNHVEAHAYSLCLRHGNVPEPHLCLTVSGGHTALIMVESPLRTRTVGTTLDDSAGEALDKIAAHLGLGYPGGPALEEWAAKGDPHSVALPRPVIDSHGFDFSFSGLKTAALLEAKRLSSGGGAAWKADLAASLQAAVVDVLVHKTFTAAQHFEARAVGACGGVASNLYLRESLARQAKAEGVQLLLASHEFCTDNAAMVAGLGWHLFREQSFASWQVDARPSWRPGEE